MASILAGKFLGPFLYELCELMGDGALHFRYLLNISYGYAHRRLVSLDRALAGGTDPIRLHRRQVAI